MSTHTLYRFFDADDQLLYVGRTINPGRRWRDHEKQKPWFDAVAKVTREVLPSALLLAEAEQVAIETEHPLHNIIMNRRQAEPIEARPVRRALYRFAEAADRLGIDESALADLVAAGEVQAVRIGRIRLIPADVLEEFKAAS